MNMNTMKRLVPVAAGLILIVASGPLMPALAGDAAPPTGPPSTAGQVAPAAPAPMTDIHDIRPPVPVGFEAPWLVPALIALAAVVLLAVLWWWWRKRRNAAVIETIIPELPPEMEANTALDRISDVRGRDGKVFYFQLSAILRQYVFGRFAVGAPEMTTEEFVPCVDRLPITRELAHPLKQLCRAMDPVKFGGLTVEEKQMERDLLFVRSFVRHTTPSETADANPSDADDAPTALPPGEA